MKYVINSAILTFDYGLFNSMIQVIVRSMLVMIFSNPYLPFSLYPNNQL